MDNPTNSAAPATAPEFPHRNYALSGKIMLAAIVILFTVVLLILCFHVYARWYLLCRSRRRRSRRLLVFTSSDRISPHDSAAANRGLDPTVLKSLPVHSYSSSAATESEECAVCLCEFEEKDACRTLPGCVHTFHIECIDMWLFSHSTCPLCRSAVESPALPSPSSVQIGIPDDPWGSGSSSSSSSSSSSASTPGRGGMRVEVPARRPAEAEEHKSPVLTIKGVLSMDLGFHHEGDLEMGGGGGGGAGGSDTDDGAALEVSAPFPESVDGNPAVDRDTCQRGGISLC